MKRFLLLAAVLLSLTGCQAAAQEETATLDTVMAAALAEGMLPVEEEPAEEEAPAQWDGKYADGTRSVTLSLGTDGSLTYRFSEGSTGCTSSVSGTTAKTSSLYFSLSGDTLTVVGSTYTGNYLRQ